MSMMTSDRAHETFPLRFRAAMPHSDESLSSALDRAASLWGITRREVLRYLGHARRQREDFDGALAGPLLQSMAHAFNMNPADLASRNVRKARLEVLLAPRLRHAYCPLCFENDWFSGITPYFRLDWGRFWMTHCRVHATPLFEWMALSGYGDRRLPHAYFLPYDASASLSYWIAVNLREARAWQSSVPQGSEAYDLWRALIKAESDWWSAGIGDPCVVPQGVAVASEHVFADLAPLFLTARTSGQLCLAEALHVPRYQHHVFGYDRRRQGREVNGSFKRLRWRLSSIQARRIVLILVAHTLGVLDVDLRFATGAKLPAGRSHAWVSSVLDHQDDYRVAHNKLYALNGWFPRPSLGT